MAEAKTVVQTALNGITADNSTTKLSIQTVIDNALSTAEITDVTVTVGNLTKSDATTSAAGSIAISKGDASDSVAINKTIAQLPKTDKEKAADVKTEVEKALATFTASNSTTAADIIKLVTDASSKLGYTGITGSFGNTFNKEDATSTEAGSITGTLTIKSGDKTETIIVALNISKLDVIKVNQIFLNKKSMSLILGKSDILKAVVAPANATNKSVTWKSSNASVAKVSTSGKVSAVGIGAATITCTAEDGSGEKATCKIKVLGSNTVVSIAKATSTNTTITIIWNKVDNASGYEIYGAKCGKTTSKKIKTITKASTTSWKATRLKKATPYKYYVKAYKNVSGKRIYIKTSTSLHIYTTGGKYTNAKYVTSNFSAKTLRIGNTKQIKAKSIKLVSSKKLGKHVAEFRYKSTNSKVATVSAGGKIKAIGKGKCYVYVIANNGVNKKITVTVK